MKKRILAAVVTVVLAAAALAGCGSKEKEAKTIKVAALAVPHAEILEAAKPLMEAKGYTLEVKVFDDYIQPNMVVESEEFDCNYFQHIPYLESFNEEQGTHLVNAGGIHYEPLGIYPGKESDLSAIGEETSIAIPDDSTNEARALLLLQANGIITLKEGAGLLATVRDIEENPYNIEFVELESAQIPRMLQDVSFGVLNGNYAMQAGLNAKTDALAYETADSEAAQTYVNIIAVKEGHENDEGIKALVEVLQSDEITKFIEDTYQGAVVPFK